MAGVEVVFIVNESHYALGKGGDQLSSMWNSIYYFFSIWTRMISWKFVSTVTYDFKKFDCIVIWTTKRQFCEWYCMTETVKSIYRIIEYSRNMDAGI